MFRFSHFGNFYPRSGVQGLGPEPKVISPLKLRYWIGKSKEFNGSKALAGPTLNKQMSGSSLRSSRRKSISVA